MPYSVTVLITGIALLVNRPTAVPRTSTSPPTYVLLASNPATQESIYYPAPEEGGGVVPRHVAFVKFRLQDLVRADTDRTIDAVITAPPGGETYGVCILKGESIDLSVTGAPATLTADSSPCVLTSATRPGDRLPLTCISSLGDVCKICGTLLDSASLPATAVGGRLNLTTGRLTATQADGSRVWYFDPQPESLPQLPPRPMPQAIALDVTMPTPDLVLSFRDSAGKLTSLKVRASSETLPLVVTIGSAPVEDVLNLGISTELNDHHFELYYGFLDMSKVQHPPIPKRVGTVDNPLTGTLPQLTGNGNCPPSGWP
jgi:hypothetical protein